MIVMNRKKTIKIIFTLGLITYLLKKLDLDAVYSTFIGMNLELLALSFPFIGLMYSIKTKKWQILLDCIDIKIPFYNALKIILIGTFYGALTPGRFGELSRSFYLKADKSKTIPTVILDRILDILCLLLLSILSIALFFKDNNLINLLLLMIILFISGIVALTNERFISILFDLLNQKKAHKENYIETIDRITGNKGVLLYTFSLSLSFYFVNLLVYWIILKALNPMLNNIIVFSLPIITILSNIPISISGIGVREFVSVTIFTMLNENPEYGFSFSIILYVLTILSPGLIGSLFIAEKR
ncbi:hypothetical protein MSSAC_1268 [Methanosarcina siciliae C2J]|uniref:Dolichol-P-glucose synthetase n=1 Tax=Methanosarcina siciliae C2J TaxID=1434118 RepID=A0A0E3PKX5_9EURY|nr:lysylphosphatidylglycerol synthase transmembrane domain-containing protein [Methanosarcina siciliae]AKB35858.1 hypothetical protein MSSAC_1268 [Methanosarcina siciliae C2J]